MEVFENINGPKNKQTVVNNIINNINSMSFQTLFLIGKKGSGKTFILNEFSKQDNVLNISNLYHDNKNFLNTKINNLYYMVVILRNIIEKIVNKRPELMPVLENYNNKLFSIWEYLEINYLAYHKFFMKNDKHLQYISKYYNNDELIKELLTLIGEEVNKYIYVIDNLYFNKDIINYENTGYLNFSKYIKIVFGVSNYDKKNKIPYLEIKYNTDYQIVEDILDGYIMTSGYIDENNLNLRIRFILSKEDIENLIQKTNGNITIMKYIIVEFYRRIIDYKLFNNNHLSKEDIKSIYKDNLDSYKRIKKL